MVKNSYLIQTVEGQFENDRLKMQQSSPFNGFVGFNNNDTHTMNANFRNSALNEVPDGVTGFPDREEEYPFDLEMNGESKTDNLTDSMVGTPSVPTQYIPVEEGSVLNTVNVNSQISSIALLNNQTVINSVPNFTFTTPTQSPMYSPPLMSSNHGYQFRRATPQTFSPTGCTPWQHSVPNRVPWMNQTSGMIMSTQGVSIFTAPLGSRSYISWTNNSPHVTTIQGPSPSCSQIPRRPKRHSSENLEYLSPTNKVHLTEKMIADHMKELSINNITAVQSTSNESLPGYTRMAEPVKPESSLFISQQSQPDITKSQDLQWQAFRDLEERLDVSDDETQNQVKADGQGKSAPKVVFLEQIPKHPSNEVIPQKILDAIQKPSPHYELVLWKPPTDVVKEVIDKVAEKEKEQQEIGQSQEKNGLFDAKEDDSTMDLDLCEGDDMML